MIFTLPSTSLRRRCAALISFLTKAPVPHGETGAHRLLLDLSPLVDP
jgi:hypothetical protein